MFYFRTSSRRSNRSFLRSIRWPPGAKSTSTTSTAQAVHLRKHCSWRCCTPRGNNARVAARTHVTISVCNTGCSSGLSAGCGCKYLVGGSVCLISEISSSRAGSRTDRINMSLKRYFNASIIGETYNTCAKTRLCQQ